MWASLRDGLRTRLWPLPTLTVLVAIVIGIYLPRLEEAGTGLVPRGLRSHLFTGGADAARSVLDAIASSMITVTALTFSLTVVTLQLASSQFSPRLLRTFTRDLVVQTTLGLFLGTFAYALTVLRTVRASSSSRSEFVPDLSVTVAFVLAVISVITLILFLAHLARTIRVESMLDHVSADALSTLDRQTNKSDGPPSTLASWVPEGPYAVVTASTSGFLVRVREQDLLAAAIAADSVVILNARPGDWVVAGTPIGAVFAMDATHPPQGATDAMRESVVTGPERTDVQDIAFGLRQLVDVAVKALSPGINDPTTALHALDHASALLGEIVQRDLGPRVVRDDEQRARAVLARPDLDALLSLALDQPARYSTTDPAVLHRLFSLLAELAWLCAPHQRAIISAHLGELRRLARYANYDTEDSAALERSAALVEEALAGRWHMTSQE